MLCLCEDVEGKLVASVLSTFSCGNVVLGVRPTIINQIFVYTGPDAVSICCV